MEDPTWFDRGRECDGCCLATALGTCGALAGTTVAASMQVCSSLPYIRVCLDELTRKGSDLGLCRSAWFLEGTLSDGRPSSGFTGLALLPAWAPCCRKNLVAFVLACYSLFAACAALLPAGLLATWNEFTCELLG